MKSGCSKGDGRPRSRRVRPVVDGLEARFLLYAANGGQWVHPELITFSFAPDGTSFGGTSSNLYATMAARGISTAAWQDAIRKAASVWEYYSGINFDEVSDDGTPFGLGDQQGDSHFGDIRFGAYSLGTSTLGLGFSPPPINGGSLAGDVILSSDVAWGTTSGVDLKTVAIHEIGHALGLGHSEYSNAAMWSYYNGVKASLISDDISGIRSVYGPRGNDVYDAVASNDTSNVATSLNARFADPDGAGPLLPPNQVTVTGGDVASSSEYDWYWFNAPSTSTSKLTVTMQSSDLSLLSPWLLLYKYNPSNGSWALTSQAYNTTAYGATISVSDPAAAPNTAYLVRASSATSFTTGAGAYGLQINLGSTTMPAIQPPNTNVAAQSDQGGGASGLGEGTGRRGDGSDRSREHDLDLDLDHDHEPQLIQIGCLTAYGDMLTMADVFGATAAPSGFLATQGQGNGGGLIAFLDLDGEDLGLDSARASKRLDRQIARFAATRDA